MIFPRAYIMELTVTNIRLTFNRKLIFKLLDKELSLLDLYFFIIIVAIIKSINWHRLTSFTLPPRHAPSISQSPHIDYNLYLNPGV